MEEIIDGILSYRCVNEEWKPMNLKQITSRLVEKEKDLKNFLEGIRRLCRGEQIHGSTSIAGSATYGYGKLDDNGYWEFPVPEEFIDTVQERNDLKESLLKIEKLAKMILEETII